MNWASICVISIFVIVCIGKDKCCSTNFMAIVGWCLLWILGATYAGLCMFYYWEFQQAVYDTAIAEKGQSVLAVHRRFQMKSIRVRYSNTTDYTSSWDLLQVNLSSGVTISWVWLPKTVGRDHLESDLLLPVRLRNVSRVTRCCLSLTAVLFWTILDWSIKFWRVMHTRYVFTINWNLHSIWDYSRKLIIAKN